MKIFNPHIAVVVVLMLGISIACFAQTIEDIRVEREGDKVIVLYNLKHDNPSERFLVKVYTSEDQFTDPLQIIKGEVGDRIAPGDNKRVEWFARQELGQFQGEVTVEIRLFESEASFYILSPVVRSKFKRGSELHVNWSGGLVDDQLEIDLYQEGSRLRSLGTGVDNIGDFSWTIPPNLKPGASYQIKLQSAGDENISAYSGNFSITRVVPLGFKIAPVALIGAAIYFLIPEPEVSDLPRPIDPN